MSDNNKKRGPLASFGSTVANLFRFGKKGEERTAEDRLREEAISSPGRVAWSNFRHNKLGMIGLIGFILIFGVVFIGAATMPFDAYYTQGAMRNIAPGTGYTSIPSELAADGVRAIDNGITFGVGVSEKGKVYVWGTSSGFDIQMPEDVKKELETKNVTQVAAGDRHIIVLTDQNEIIGWGLNSFEQTKFPEDKKAIVEAEGGIKKISANDLYSIVLTNEGTLIAWGATLPNRLNMIPPSLSKRVDDFVAGPTNVMLKLKDGKINILGVRGGEIDTTLPKELKEGTVEVVSFARTGHSAAAVDADGKLYVWGSVTDNYNQLPKDMKGKIVQVAAGREHFLALNEEGKIFAWGNNNYNVLDVPKDGPYKAIHSSYFNNVAVKEDGSVTAWGSDGFLAGTDKAGRDLWTRLIHGGRNTLIIAFISIVISLVLGTIVGMIAGFFGGRVDNLLMRFAEIVASFPFYPLIITLSAILPADTTQYQKMMMIMIILGVLGWTGIARLVRGEILAEREKDYITAARALGLKEKNIIMQHIFPNVLSLVIVQATLGYAGNLLTEAGLSFLGFGIVEPFPSWGNMMTAAQSTEVLELYWWQWIFPGMAVFLTALTVNLIGDALRDAIDPKASER